jgi:DNA-directed RNA polymerase specialized sigma24 family protein
MTVKQAREYRAIAERSGLVFVEGDGCFPYLRALAIEVTAKQWALTGAGIQYLVEREDLVAEVESEILTSGAWAKAQELQEIAEVRAYLWQAARWHLRAYVEKLIDYDRATTGLVVGEGEEAFDLSEWKGCSHPSPEEEVLRDVREPNFEYRAACAVSGKFLQALLREKHGALALRWLEGASVTDLAAEEGTSARTIQNRIFGYLPSVTKVADKRGALQRAAEEAEVDFAPTAEGFADLRAAWKIAH